MIRKLISMGALALSLAAPASAHNLEPGSLLVFPEFDSRPGSMTFLTVTNTNGDKTIENGEMRGTVRMHFVYINAEDCREHDASELLTPRDTLTTITQAHAPGALRGYVFAYARSTNGAAITFNHIVGTLMVIDGYGKSVFNMNPVAFQGQTEEGTSTDVDMDGIRDLDGAEYDKVPDQIVIPRFFGQRTIGTKDSPFESELITIDLTGSEFTTTLNLLIYNDNEQAFSGNHTFRCWERKQLNEISGAFNANWLRDFTDDDPYEVVGMPAWETGWLLLDGGTASSGVKSVSDPAFLAALIDLGRTGSAALPFGIGEQDNGDLLPAGVFGDF